MTWNSVHELSVSANPMPGKSAHPGQVDGDAATDPLASGDFMAEDVDACEQQQKSLRSPYFEHGPSSRRGEAGVRAHQALVRDWVEGGG